MVLLLAYITMVIDHVGLMFFPEEIGWRIVGRLAFPLFAWGIVRGYRMTHHLNKYLIRLGVLALVTQIPAFLVLGSAMNVIFTLLFGLVLLILYDTKKLHLVTRIALGLLVVVLSEVLKVDYGSYGVLMILCIAIFWEKPESILVVFLLSVAYYCIDYSRFEYSFHIQVYSVCALMLVYLTPIRRYDFRLGYYFKYGFYPVHFLVLYSIQQILKLTGG